MDLTTEEPSSLVRPKTTDDFSLISRASEAFKNVDYDQCLDTLGELEASSNNASNIGKVRHNRAVCEFYKSNCKDHSSLLKSLNALDAGETYTNTACYNKAVIYFHRHMHRTAIETLSPLVDRLESLEQPIGSLVGVLMLRLLLATNQLNKAKDFLEQLQLNIHFEALTLDEGSSSLKEDGLQQSFKLLAMLTNVLNRKAVVIADDGSVEFAALKAHQYYIMKDFQMAAKQLEKISNGNYKTGLLGNELNTCIANNMGVIHLRVRHYAIAAKFFQNAITFDKQISANLRTASLQNMSGARSCEILYNLGISMLHLRRPKEAFQCFLVPLKSYHSNPRLWFRIAEACIMDNEMKLLEDEKKSSSFGTRPTTRKTYPARNQSAAVPEANLDFAALSLRNALTLTAFYRSNFHNPIDEEGAAECSSPNWNNAKDNNFCNPSKPISKVALDNMLLAIYAAYSYVSLRLGDYVQALEMAQELLKAEKVSDAHKMLAHMYAGEALIMMDKLAEARPHLEPTFVSSLNAFDFETKDWQVKSLDAAQNIVRYNLAVAMVLQGDCDMASSLVSTCNHPIVSSKSASLKMYLDMRMGKSQKIIFTNK